MKANPKTDHLKYLAIWASQLSFDVVHLTILGCLDQEPVSLLDLVAQIILKHAPVFQRITCQCQKTGLVILYPRCQKIFFELLLTNDRILSEFHAGNLQPSIIRRMIPLVETFGAQLIRGPASAGLLRWPGAQGLSPSRAYTRLNRGCHR